MNWQEEQQAFWDWITRPQDLRNSEAAIESLLGPHQELSTVEALGIYNNAYHQRLIQISAELYPVLYHTLGEAVYTRLWMEYIAEHPPRPGAMSILGEQLLSFTRQHAQFGQLPALLDIIELESLLISLFDQPDETIYTRADLQALPIDQWPATRWQARQDWALMHSQFDLEKYWARMQEHLARDEMVPGVTDFGVDAFEPPQTIFLLVRRINHRMQFQRINRAMMIFLQGIQAGKNFADLCEALAGEFPDQDIPALSLSLLLKSIEMQLLAK